MAREAPEGDKARREEISGGAHHRRTEARLVLGGFSILLVVGGLLIVLLLGIMPAAMAVGIMLLVAGLLLGLYKGLELLEKWLKEQ